MPADPAHPSEGGYGVRYAEDSFDYPSPSLAESWSQSTQPLDAVPDADLPTRADSADEEQSTHRGPARETGWWGRMVGRRRAALMVVAALLIMGGFGLPLSMVSSTVSSDPAPGTSSGTSQVTRPRSPAVSALPPQATASASSPEGGTSGSVTISPTQVSPLPGTGGQGDNQGGQDRREDHGREDGDHADDG